jgi:hypothetical protein
LIRPRRWRGHQSALGGGLRLKAEPGQIVVFDVRVFDPGFRGKPGVVGLAELSARPPLGLLSLNFGGRGCGFLFPGGGFLEKNVSDYFITLQPRNFGIDGGFWRSGGVCPIRGANCATVAGSPAASAA